MDARTQPNTLIEHIADWYAGLTVDRTNLSVRNVALTGVTSRNGYRYTEQALRDAAVLYDQKPVFLDHAVDRSRPHQRSTRDLVGTIVNPRFESGRIRGDIRVLDTESGRTFLALSESDAPGVGMSHVVLAQRAAADGSVERIHDVVSVDAVVFPATTKTFRESLVDPLPEENAEDSERISAAGESDDETAADGDDRSSANVTPESVRSDMHRQLQQLLAERDELLAQLQDFRSREEVESQERRVEQALNAARLPRYAMTADFRRQLLQADADAMPTLIAERRQLIESARREPPRSRERPASQRPADADSQFVAAIKRRAF